MIVNISNSHIKEAINLVSLRAKSTKRILSPDPDNEPYWHHLVRVYYWLIKLGENDINLLIASILHDSVEDNYIKLEDITKLFGNEVAEIVGLLTEKIYSDHNSSSDRSYYFQEIDKYKDPNIRLKAIKIKVADRYDNLIGLSYTNFESKKDQYRREVSLFFVRFAKEVGMSQYINEGLEILDKKRVTPDIKLVINFIEDI